MKIQNYGFAHLRRPLLSKAALDSFHQQCSKEPEKWEKILIDLYKDPVLMAALSISSFDLAALTAHLIEGKQISGKSGILLSLYKYFVRMTTRCTPFGLFAGHFDATLGAGTDIRFCKTSAFEIFTSISCGSLWHLKEAVMENLNLSRQLRYYPNSSLYKAGNTYRFIKVQQIEGQTVFSLQEVNAGSILANILQKSASGLRADQIQAYLAIFNFTKSLAISYVQSLIREQILLSEIEMNITGQDYHSRFKQALLSIKGTGAYLKIFNHAERLSVTDAGNLAFNCNGPSVNQQNTRINFQAQMRITTQKSVLSAGAISTITASIEKLSVFFRAVQNPEMAKFASNFFRRYGRQTIPLLTALDHDYGVGYGSPQKQIQQLLPLLDGVDYQGQKNLSHQADSNEFVEEIYFESLRGRLRSVALEKTVTEKKVNFPTATIPNSFYLFGSIIATSQKAFDKGDFTFDLKVATGPSAANLISRFSLSDTSLQKKVMHIAAIEQELNPDSILAEIAHVPGHHAANIAQRPDLREFQIRYLSQPSGTTVSDIQPGDLLLSCPDGKNIMLTSKILKKKIIPVLSCAHNFSNGLPVYRFLCDLGMQQNSALYWDWGKFADKDFLPRIIYEKIILSKASWRIGQRQLSLLNEAEAKAKEYKKEPDLLSWWEQFKMQCLIEPPRFFTIGFDDQQLLIDVQHLVSLRLLARMLKVKGSLRLTEALESMGTGLLSTQGSNFNNEIVIPFFTSAHDPIPQAKMKQSIITQRREFEPGSSWLFIKIYCTERISDQILTKKLDPFCTQMLKEDLIEKWFYVRYRDPLPHIRVRFYSERKDFWAVLLKRLQTLLAYGIKDGSIQNIQTESYQRELERYAVNPYALAESLFYFDSKAVSGCLVYLSKNENETQSWLYALKSTDMLLSDLKIDHDGKIKLMDVLFDELSKEQDPDQQLKRESAGNFRRFKSQITRILPLESTSLPAPARRLLKQRSENIARVLTCAKPAQRKAITSAAADFVHMSLNRWFFTRQREQELVIYHFLKKYYCTQKKMHNKKINIPESCIK